MEALLRQPQPLVDRLWQSEVAAGPLDTPEQRAGLKQRLHELAATIADPSVRKEYENEFKNRFYEHFAPKRRAFTPSAPRSQGKRGPDGQWKQPIAPPTEDVKAFHAAGIDRVLAKAILAGLIRHPVEIARHMEVLGSLKLIDGALGRLFEAVVDVALEDQALDSARLRTILAKSGFDAIASDLLRADTMPYSFTQSGGDPARARADLDEAIAIMVARPEVDMALGEATASMQAHFTAEAFERQVALVKEKQGLELRLANLVQSNEDARSFGSEGN